MPVDTEKGDPKKIQAYLAGPDVFLPDPIQIGKNKKAILAPYGIEGRFPFDNEFPADCKDAREIAAKIALANEDMMSKCTVILANLMPWYGPGADNGTTFEMGFMSARAMLDPNILIIGYYPDGFPDVASKRVAEMVYNGKVKTNDDGSLVSTETGRAIEKFGLLDNLMIIGAINKTGGKIYGSFEEAAADVNRLLAEKQKQNAQKQPVPKKEENTLWGYSLAKCSRVDALKAVAGVAAVVGGLAYAAKRSKCF